MLQLPSIPFLWQALTGVVRRFPGAFLCVCIAVFALLSIIELESGRYDEWPHALIHQYVAVWMVAQLGLPIMIGLHALRSQQRWPMWYEVAAGAVVAGLLVFYYLQLKPGAPHFDSLPLPRYLALWCVAHLFVSVAPYLNRLSVADFWEYNKDLFTHFIVGGIFTLVLFAGLSGALLAVDKLFDLHVKGHVYPQMLVLLVGFFHVSYFLYHFPTEHEVDHTERGYHAILKNLCKYILIPLTILYFVILYAYGFKILLQWNLPQGWVSSLVLGFSVVGVLTWLLTYRLPAYDDNGLVHIFHKWFWPVLLPLLVLLFVAIGRRLSDYGVTEERYLVAHTGLWLLICALWYIISRRDNIKFIPLSLAVFTLIAAFGPLSMFRVSDRSQKSNLKALLSANGRFADGKAQPGTAELEGKTAQRIESVLYYFDRRGRMQQLQEWLPPQADSLLEDLNTGRLAQWLNIQPVMSVPYAPDVPVRSYYPQRQQVISTGGYDHLLVLALPRETVEDTDSLYNGCRLSADGRALLVRDFPPLVADTLPLDSALHRFKALEGEYGQVLLKGNNNIIALEGRHYKGLLVVQQVQMERNSSFRKARSVDGLLFLEKK